MDLKEFLGCFDFDYEILSGNEVGLIDLQGANLGGIEQDRFPLHPDNLTATVEAIIGRMDVYVNDSMIAEFEEALEIHDIDSSDMNLEEMVIKCKELGVTEDVSYVLADVIIHPEKIKLPLEVFADENSLIITQAKGLPEGWLWRDWDDGSGCLISPDGEKYFGYDLHTREWEVPGISGSNKWRDISNDHGGVDFPKFKEMAVEWINKNVVTGAPASLSSEAKDARDASAEMASDSAPVHTAPEL